MSKYDLSIFLGGIRTNNWQKLYESIEESIGEYSWELVICSPYDLPEFFADKDNILLIKDFGCPTRAYQLAALNCSGKHIVYAADDGWFLQNKLKECLDKLQNKDYTTILVAKYIEGGKDYNDQEYYLHYHADVRFNTYPSTFILFNVAFITRQYFEELGGFDCQFEVCPLAFVDFGVRAQRDTNNIEMLWEPIFECTQLPGPVGDHKPIHDAQVYHDTSLYSSIYSNPNSVNRIKIDINNWQNAPERWIRRFGEIIN